MAAMRCGEFARAWRISDAVLASRDPTTRDDPRMPYHLRWVWDGRAWRGRHVLVRCYHGLGDTLQFTRLLPLLARDAASVTLEAQPELLPLLREAPGIDRALAFDKAAPLPLSECDIESMELPHALRLLPADIPTPAIRPTPRRAATVGLCWQAGPWDPARSVPAAALVAACAAPGRRLFSLQRGGEAPPGLTAHPFDGSMAVGDTAALIGTLDCVVSVDTMVAHLAGYLGAPTLLLLPAKADWRWLLDTEHSPWYPSMRLIRQRAHGDWTAPLAELRRRLPA